MALPKLYEQIVWHNNTTPAINEDNLNSMSQAIDDIDDRVIEIASTIMEDVPQIIEDMATVEAGLETVGQAVTDAQTAATSATADKLKSEGFAVGEQNGVPVDSSSPYYHNNAKYYSQVAPPTAAAHVSYDHSQSYLAATNVQGAVDELNADMTYKRGDTIAISSNPLYLSALFQDSKHLRLTIPINKPISASGATVTINSLQIFNNGNYEVVSTGLTATAYKVNGVGLYVIIENAANFTTYTALANAMIRFDTATITFT